MGSFNLYFFSIFAFMCGGSFFSESNGPPGNVLNNIKVADTTMNKTITELINLVKK